MELTTGPTFRRLMLKPLTCAHREGEEAKTVPSWCARPQCRSREDILALPWLGPGNRIVLMEVPPAAR